MGYTITPLSPHTGAEVRGIDLNEGVEGETRAALNRAFAEHHVLVVRGQQFTPPRCSRSRCRAVAATPNTSTCTRPMTIFRRPPRSASTGSRRCMSI